MQYLLELLSVERQALIDAGHAIIRDDNPVSRFGRLVDFKTEMQNYLDLENKALHTLVMPYSNYLAYASLSSHYSIFFRLWSEVISVSSNEFEMSLGSLLGEIKCHNAVGDEDAIFKKYSCIGL